MTGDAKLRPDFRDARRLGLGAVCAQALYVIALFADEPLPFWITSIVLATALTLLCPLPAWRETAARRRMAGALMVAEAFAVAVIATVVRKYMA